MTQTEKVLNAFLTAPNRSLTTGQLDKLPYITCQRQEVSRLRQRGHIIVCERIKGTNSSTFTYIGFSDTAIYKPDAKCTQWHPIGNGFEAQYV